jgi:hypothetical protein
MSQYQNLPISTSTSTSIKKNIQYSTRPVPVQPKYWQYQYQYQYNKYWSNLTAKFEIFERKVGFSCGKFKFREAVLNFWVWNWNLKRKNLTYFVRLHGCQFIYLSFADFFVLVLVLIGSVLARSVPVQSQYLKTGPVPVPVPVHQYQKWSVDWKNQYQYQWTDSSIGTTPNNSFFLARQPMTKWYLWRLHTNSVFSGFSCRIGFRVPRGSFIGTVDFGGGPGQGPLLACRPLDREQPFTLIHSTSAFRLHRRRVGHAIERSDITLAMYNIKLIGHYTSDSHAPPVLFASEPRQC